MKNLFIGIDISKEVFDYCAIDEQNQIVINKQVAPNSKDGIEKFCQKLDQLKEYSIWIAMEHTGHYGSLLCYEFSIRQLCYSLINPLEMKHATGISRGKTDAVDAWRIASYALANKHKLKPYILPAKELRKLKILMSSRERLVKVHVQMKNGLKSLEIEAKIISLKSHIQEMERIILQIEKSILSTEKQMREIIKQNDELKNNFQKITSVIGVGEITAIKCILETDNFTKFNNPRKFSCHCGLAPFKYQSGSSIRGKTKTSSLCDKSLKSILFKAACSAIQHDPQLKNYYLRKTSEGKHKLSVINAVASKIVLRIFAISKRKQNFVKLFN